MKRLTALLLALILAISAICLASCNEKPENTLVPTEAPTQAPTQKPTEAPTQAPTQQPTQKPQLSEEELFEEMLATLIDEYGGKRLSVFGDSISTFAGISNNTDYNSTIGDNAVYYHGNDHGLTSSKNTYWGRFCERVGTQLCVNNSWSGDAMRSGRFRTRAVNLHKNTGAKPVDPDVIFVYFGINDVWGKDGTTAQPNGNLNEFVRDRGSMTVNEVTEEWMADVLERYESGDLILKTAYWDELYAIVMHTITDMYPDAKIVNIGLTVNTHPSYSACTELVPEHNESIQILSEYYGTVYVDQMAAINSTNLHKYMGDGKGSYLHPNNAGHGVLFEEIVKALYNDLIEE